jgi:hypothetical protein
MKPTNEMIAAAWQAWHKRHGGKLGPGPAFVEAIEAALAVMPQFGTFIERDDGTTEFRRTGESFTPTAQGYKAWFLYAGPESKL